MKSLADLACLRGRVALITGGAGHLGRVFAESLAEQGASVALVDRPESAVSDITSVLRGQFSVPVLSIAADLADDEVVASLPRRVGDALGGLDILINNAAFVGTSKLDGWVTPFEEQHTDVWRAALEVNLTATFTLCREAAPLLRLSGHGSIINIASIYGVCGPNLSLYEGTSMGNPAAYAASKGGLIQLTRWLATVLAPKVRVNSISPGGVWRNQPETFVRRYEEQTPLGRMATEEDFKGALIYLASDLSVYVTGQNLMVDGGFGVW